jgi:hypothetical protein
MLPSTVSYQGAIELTGGVCIDYTANLRCTHLFSANIVTHGYIVNTV